MIIRTRQGDVELRSSAEWGSSAIPQPGSGYISSSGSLITPDQIFGLSAVSNVIRSPSEMLASLPFLTYNKKPRTRAETSWQWELLHENPDDLGTGTYQFFYDCNLSLEAAQNLFIQKVKGVGHRSRRLEALYVIDPQRVRCRRAEDGTKRFDVYVGGQEGTKYDLTDDVILHVRGFSPHPGSACGMSLLEFNRDALSNSTALQSFEGDYFRNNAQPPFWFTGAKNKEHATELVIAHNERHQGPGKQYRVGAVWGATDVKAIPITMADAQYVEAKQMSVEEACRIWRWPKELMEMTNGSQQAIRDENAWMARMMKIYMLPRLSRIERGFAADKDLYVDTGLVGNFLTAALERVDFESRMRGYKDARQGGWITANEIRDHEDYEPHKQGDTLLETPTGSAPNQIGPTSGNGAGSKEAAAAAIEQEIMS
jgi:HK97 family phage portal protein